MIFRGFWMVRDRGFEPLTPSVSRKCSTTELTARSKPKDRSNVFVFMVFLPILAWLIVLISWHSFKPKSPKVRTDFRMEVRWIAGEYFSTIDLCPTSSFIAPIRSRCIEGGTKRSSVRERREQMARPSEPKYRDADFVGRW